MSRSAAAFILATAAAVVMLLAAGCQSCAPNPLQGGIQSYSGSKWEEPQQPQQTPIPQPAPQSKTQTIERHETVTEANSVFSIGAPAVGYIEERQVTAQQPVNFWFEYLNPDMSLTLNGFPVEITSQRGAGRTA
ncbi:MAG: hypothetical protein WC541_09170, partial [Dehalococcoidia bacterium]